MADFGMSQALGIGGGAVGAGLSVYGASERNQQIGETMNRANDAAAEEIAQQGRIAGVQTRQTREQAARIRGAIRVSTADRGVGFGGSAAALERDAAIKAGRNTDIINLNRYGSERSTLAALRNTQAQLSSQAQELWLAGLTGALGGAQTGLSIGTGIENMGRRPGATSGVEIS